MDNQNEKTSEPEINLPASFDFIPVDHHKSVCLRIKEVLAELERVPTTKGKNILKKYYAGEKLTPREMVISKCADCMAYHADGLCDCEVYWCSLYPLMPYGLKRKAHIKRISKGATQDGGSAQKGS